MKSIYIAIASLFMTTGLYAQPINYEWAIDMGGRSQHTGRTDMVKFQDEFIFVYGEFQGTRNFGSVTLTSNNNSVNVFVALYDTSGQCFWAVKGGGTNGSVNAGGIAVDNNGFVYVTGYFSFNMTFGALPSIFTFGSSDVFIAKLDISGSPQWIRQAEGTLADESYSIACNNTDIVLTGSYTSSATFGTTTLTTTSSTDIDIFIAKYDLAGNCVWAKRAGGTTDDKAYAIKRDYSNNIVITGYFTGTATFGTNQVVSSSSNDVFLAKYDDNGTNLWAAGDGGGGNDNGRALGVDQFNNYIIGGDIGPGALFGTFNVSGDNYGHAFIAKYNSSGVVQWANSGGGTGSDAVYAIAVHPSGGCYITGFSESQGIQFGTFNFTGNGLNDIFIVRLNPGGTFIQAATLGGPSNDNGKAILLGYNGDAYLSGEFITSMTVGSTTLTTTGIVWNTFLVGLHGGVTGIQEPGKKESQIIVYPNPVTDKINFVLPPGFANTFSLEIFDVKGKVVLKQRFDSVNTEKITLSTDQLKKGNYYFVLDDGKRTARSEFSVIK